MDMNENNNIIQEETPEATVLEEQMPANETADETIQTVEQPIVEQPAVTKKSNKKIIIVIIILLAAIISGFFLTQKFIIPLNKYNKALSLRENNQFDEAVAIFSDLGTFKDSQEQVKKTLEGKEIYSVNLTVEKAKNLYKNGSVLEAYKLLKTVEDKEKTKALLDEYEQALLDSVADDYKIGYNPDTEVVKYCHKDGYDNLHCSYGVAGAIFYCADSSATDYHFSVVMEMRFYAAFSAPINPETVKFSNSKTSVEVAVGYYDRGVMYDYYIVENITTSISLEEFNKIIEILKDEEEPVISITGHSLSKDFSLNDDSRKVALESYDYINALYETKYRDILPSDKITSKTTYKDAVKVMIEIIEMIDTDGLTQVLVDDFKLTYSKISDISNYDKELSKQVNIVYNMYKSFYEYCLDPYIEEGDSSMLGVNDIYISTFKTTSHSIASSQLATLKNML